MKKIFIKLIAIVCLCLVIIIFNTTKVFACCEDNECNGTGGGQCLGAGSDCNSGGTQGFCVENFNTCSGSANSQPCTAPEVCVGGLCQLGSGSCFPAGTGITLGDGSKRNIEDIKVGDSVQGLNDNGERTISTVEKLIQPISDNMCTIDFNNSEKLEVTKSHPLLTNNGWEAIDKESALLEKPGVEINSLTVGDSLYKEDGKKPVITSISCRSEKVKVYNFTVDNSHTYFANGFLAHNKGGGGGPSCVAGVNCPAGWTPAWGQPIYSDICDQSSPTTCSLGTAQQHTGCCTVGCARQIVTTYACCAPGTVDTCVMIPQGTHSVTIGPYRPDLGPGPNCGTEVYVGGWSVNYCYQGDLAGNPVSGGRWQWCYYNQTCQIPDLKSCSCVANCTASAPTAPSLLAPTNGATVSATSVGLSWSAVSTWGTGCPSNTNDYKVYVGTSAGSLSLVTSTTSSSTIFNGVSGQTYYWRVESSNGSQVATSPTWSFTISVISTPWWQVKDGDVTASNGDILSIVPNTYIFDLDGSGGFPGVPVYSGGLSYAPGLLSSKNWKANTQTTQGRIFDYTYFKNLIPDSVTPTTNSALLTSAGFVADGYEWFKITGNLSLNNIDFGSRKVILFVENGDLTLNGKINVTDGVGFFGAFVNGKIIVKSTVSGTPALEGIYLSDGSFTSELSATQLHVRGSVASYGGMVLQRNLVDDSVAAELFEYAPDQILLFPKKLAYRRTKWAEIAP